MLKHQYVSRFGKLRSGTDQFSFQSQRRRAMPKNIQTTIQWCSFHIANKGILKILQGSLQQYMNWELSDVQAEFQRGRGTINQIGNIHWIMIEAREFLKTIYFYFFDYTKAFDGVDDNKLWKTFKEMGVPDHLTCLPRNLYAVKKQQNWTCNNWLV